MSTEWSIIPSRRHRSMTPNLSQTWNQSANNALDFSLPVVMGGPKTHPQRFQRHQPYPHVRQPIVADGQHQPDAPYQRATSLDPRTLQSTYMSNAQISLPGTADQWTTTTLLSSQSFGENKVLDAIGHQTADGFGDRTAQEVAKQAPYDEAED